MMVRGGGAGGRIGVFAAGLAPTGDADNTGGGTAGTGADGTAGRVEAADAAAEGCAVGAGGVAKVGLAATADATAGDGVGAGAEGIAIFGDATGAVGWVAATGAAAEGRGAGGTTAGACCFRMAFRTSPGREIWERSILVLISSLSARGERDGFAEPDASLAFARKCARTLTAS